MQLPLQITFRGIPTSEAIEANIRKKAAKLEEFFPTIMSCRVVVEASHHHHHKGNLYDIRIDVKVPEKEIVVSRSRHDQQAHEDIYVAIRDAFAAAQRQLEDVIRLQRGQVKNHTPAP